MPRISCSVVNNSLEEKVIQVFKKIGCNIDSNNIEACHRLTKSVTELSFSFL